MRSRVRPKVFDRDDLSINLLELLAMTVTAWAFTVQAATPPNNPGASILVRGTIVLVYIGLIDAGGVGSRGRVR